MRRLLKSTGWPCLATVLLAAWASLASSAPPKGLEGIATDASDMKIELAHLLKRNHVESEPRTKSLAAGLIAPSAPVRPQSAVRGACEFASSSFCYDLAGRHVIYRPARGYMPKIDGLRAESVSLHRNSISFRYSFR